MKILEKIREKIIKISLIIVILFMISNYSIAAENPNTQNENNENTGIELTLSDYINIPEGLGRSIQLPSRFSLQDVLNLRVENQGTTNECWAFSTIKSLETNIALKSNERNLQNFSERHMDYATSRTFWDGTNEKGFYRDVGDGGAIMEGLVYLTNGQGAVLESDMPFENNEVLIPLSFINKNVDTVVNDYYLFPTINKEYTYDSNGNTSSVRYFKTDRTEYTDSELNSVRKVIKEHIMNNGSIATMTVGAQKKFYDGTTIFNSTSYNCNESDYERDHAFSIIGWDDNYSKDNFAEGHKPSTDGAYIILNSYGISAFNNGILYVSYEDKYIEKEIEEIISATKKDYDNIYQKDFYGGLYQISIQRSNVGYYGAIFDRDTSKNEFIDSIGVTLSSYCNVEVYINPNGSNININQMEKVATVTDELNPGYHRIYFTPTKLNGNRFAVAIKQISGGENFCFEIEAPEDETPYMYVTSDNKSYISSDGMDWTNLKDIRIAGIDFTNADVCIKAFTDEISESNIEITSTNYKIEENYIYNVRHNTSIEEFKNNINSNSEYLEVLSNGQTVSTGRLKTGMKLKLSDDSEYTIIIRGDTNLDGKISLTDLSKLIMHYNETEGFILSGNALKSADMNLDGKVSIVDISQMLVLYNSL